MRLIDGHILMERLQEQTEVMTSPDVALGVLMAQRVILNAPTIDAEPVKHGEWVYNPNAYDYGLPAWECDQCGCINANIPPRIMTKDGKPNYAPVNPNSFSGSNYCPNCGAKMDKGGGRRT